MDCALAIAISTIPGMAETDAQTRALYQSIAKRVLANELKSKGQIAHKGILRLAALYPRQTTKVA